jgi:hypothetical protein
MFLELLVEGSSDVPTVREILTRRFRLVEDQDFRIHPHTGKGALPDNPLAQPEPTNRTLLHQLPAKLRGYSYWPQECGIVVLVDADDDDCRQLKRSLLTLYHSLPRRPPLILFRVAVEETESWFLADRAAIRKAYPSARVKNLPTGPPDRVIGAWEHLARVLRRDPRTCTGADKVEWGQVHRPAPGLE